MLSTFYLSKEKKAYEDLVVTTADLLYHCSKCINSEQRLLESVYEKIRVEAITFKLIKKREERPEVELQFFTDDYGEEFVSKVCASDFTNSEHEMSQRTKMVDILPYKRYFGYFNQVKLSDTKDIPFLRIHSLNDINFTLVIEFSFVPKGKQTINHKFDRVFGTFKYGIANKNVEVGKIYSLGGGNNYRNLDGLEVDCCSVVGFTNTMFSFGEGEIDPPKLSIDFNIMFDLDTKKSENSDTKFLSCPILFDLVKKIHPYPPSCISKSKNIDEMPSENNLIDVLFNGLTIRDFQSGNIERHKGTYVFGGSIRRLPEHVAYNFQERGDSGEMITKHEIESSLYD